MPVDPKNLIKAQIHPEFIRNICILAHVDHGKTSLSDTLLASNGIISQAMQGQIRYLDSRPDEQLRGITMESSAISLFFKMARRPENEGDAPKIEDYLVNLIDSPGHIDFSSEVSIASRLCDCAVVLVDAVEGVSSQTITVLKQTWDEQLKPILAINKIDRLISELQLTPTEAYIHLTKLVEAVNAVLGSFFSGKRMEEDYKAYEAGETGTQEELSDEDIYFDPAKNNVVFCSAIDGWGFTIGQFAAIHEKRLGVKREKLERFLWGDFFLDPKTKKVVKGVAAKEKSLKPMFVQFILDNVWAVYSAVNAYDTAKIEKIVTALNLKVSPRDINSSDTKHKLSMIFNQWIPVSRSILTTVVNALPSPKEAQSKRITQVLERTPAHTFIDKTTAEGMLATDAKAPVVGFVSKVIQVAKKDLPIDIITDRISELRIRSERIRKDAQMAAAGASDNVTKAVSEVSKRTDGEDEEVVIGFTRVFSGTITVGQELDLLGPKYNPETDSGLDAEAEAENSTLSSNCTDGIRTPVKVTGLYLLMGRDMIPIKTAYPGNIVGVAGLDGKIIKSGTLVSPGVKGPNLASSNIVAPPILRVALEPEDPTKLPELEKGLELLNISDPSVEFTLSDIGEYILGTAGELHLERCLKDLKERFAKIEIDSSTPVVPYRETYVEGENWIPDPETPDKKRGNQEITVAGVTVNIQVLSLPQEVADLLVEPATEEKILLGQSESIKADLVTAFETSKDPEWKDVTDSIVSFGPRHAHSNLLIDRTGTGALTRRVFGESSRGIYDDSVLGGFQAAMAKGPLVAEPVHGMAIIVTKIENEASNSDTISGLAKRRIISATRELIYAGLEDWSPRLMLAMYLCDIQAPSEVLGKVYGVVTRRRGKVLTEEHNEGTPFFTVTASIPVIESFGFSDEIRKRTSGAAYPQLVFDGFKLLDEDPYWVPTTEEDLEEHGEIFDRENIALSYVQTIRRQKGLRVNQKLVDKAEQQRSFKH